MPEKEPSVDLAECFAKLAREVIEGDRTQYVLYDLPALECIHNGNLTHDARREGLARWLHYYKVLMSFTHEQRGAICSAILTWADDRNLDEPPVTAKEIDTAHSELIKACCTAYHDQRGFESLASKALWLCYPEHVPLFDRFASVPGIIPAGSNASPYERFVHYWQQLFIRYSHAIDAELALVGNERFCKAKVFDGTLWMLGRPDYTLPPVGST